MNEIIYFLPMIIFLGAVTTYEDIKHGKIRNKWILIALAYAIIVNIALVVYLNYGINQSPRIEYFIELSISFTISLMVGFLMWWINLWTAGDAKLFAAFAALVPLSVYRFGHIPFFSSSNILINTFVPFFVVYTLFMLYRTTWRQKLHYMLKSFEPRQLVTLALFLFAFMWPIKLLFNMFSVPANLFTTVAVLFLVLAVFERILADRLIYLISGVAVLRFIGDASVYTLGSWTHFGLTLGGFVFLRFFILYMGYDFMTKHVDIGLLKPGMVPAESVFMDNARYCKKPILHFSLLSYMQEKTRKRKYLFEPAPEGLTKKDVARLRIHEKDFGFEHLRVYKTLSFAPYMFAGVLLTILLQGNIFVSIVTLVFG